MSETHLTNHRSHRRAISLPMLVRIGLLGIALWIVVTQSLASNPVVPAVRQDGLGNDSVSVVVYFAEGPLLVAGRERDGTLYLPIEPVLNRLALGRTDATGFGTLTIRGNRETIELSNGSPVITSPMGDLELTAPARREDDTWWAPPDFLTSGIGPATGRRFSIEAAGRRVVESGLPRTALDMNAESTGAGARLTIQSGEAVNIRVQQDREQNRVVLSIDRAPLAPSRESLDYRDTTIRSVRFDDTDGTSKIVVDTGPLANVRLVPGDGNRTFTVDFFPANATLSDPAAVPDVRASAGAVRVIVIDAGHGGLDSGTTAHGTLEKDLTLAIAEELRARLSAELDATVVMTRGQDREMDVETRASIANNNRGSLLISLHVGFSPDETESLASLFVMRPLEDLPGSVSGDSLFRPWYRAHVASQGASREFAEAVAARLERTVPRFAFEVREAPLAILVGAAMPAVVMEVGNINNPDDIEALGDATLRKGLIDGIVEGIRNYGRTRR